MDFVWLLMSNSELLRIKNKQKTPYKKQKTASSKIKYNKRPNDRFGLNLYSLDLFVDFRGFASACGTPFF